MDTDGNTNDKALLFLGGTKFEDKVFKVNKPTLF